MCEFKPKHEGFSLCCDNRIEMNQSVNPDGSTRFSPETCNYLKTFAYIHVQRVASFLVTSSKNPSCTFYLLMDLYCALLTYFNISHCKFCLCSCESQAKSSCPVYTQQVTLVWINFQRFRVSQSLNEVKYFSPAKKVTRFVPNLRHKFSMRHHYSLCCRLLGKVLLGGWCLLWDPIP